MRRLRATLFMILALSPAACCYSKPLSHFVQTELTDKVGLPQNSVSSITQTTDGYLWFGTEEGIARFDGVRVTVFSTITHRELKDNYIAALASGKDGSLWIGTRSGLLQYKNGVFKDIFHLEHPINVLFEGVDGTIWVGTYGKLYAVQRGVTHVYGPGDGIPPADILSITQNPDGSLLLGCPSGLFEFFHGRFIPVSAPGIAPNTPIQRVLSSRDGSVWIVTPTQLLQWKGKNITRWPTTALPAHNRISSLVEDRNGRLWIGLDHGGIAYLQNGQFLRYSSKDGLPADDVKKIFEDREGHIWVGLSESGVVELREGLFETFGVREGLSENMVWTVMEARDGSEWVGTNSKGLNHILKDGTVRTYTARDGLPREGVAGISEGTDGTIWIGSEHGTLSSLRGGKIQQYHFKNGNDSRLTAILQDKSGDLWLLYHRVDGLVRFHQGQFQQFKVPGLLNTGSIAPDGSLWLGSDHGGVIHFQNGTVTNYTTQNGLLSDFAQAVYIDREGVVWAGTSPGGLNRIKNGTITTYSLDQGIFDLTVGSVIEDDYGNLWMTCNRGIFRVSKSELNAYAEGKISAVHSVVYGTADGMREAECNFGDTPSVWKGAGGKLLFATVAGVASIFPNQTQTHQPAPDILIEDVLSSGKSVPFEDGVRVAPGTSNFEIRFSAPDFISPRRLRFRYRLNKLDQNWIDAGFRRMAIYNRIEPGNYTFEIQAAREVDRWDSETTSLKVAVLPYFWQTRWFRTLCGLLVLGIAVLLYRLRTRALIRRNLQLEARVLQRTKELEEANAATEAARAALLEQATKDGLTKLWNRRSIFEIIDREISLSTREGRSFCVLMADIDHFKSLNDSLGHQAGDCVLQTIAGRMGGAVRPYDAVGRYGGEEFVLMFSHCGVADGLTRAEELRSAIASEPVMYGEHVIHVTCSFGLALYTDGTISELIAAADEGLYTAKRAGRNCVYIAGRHAEDHPRIQPKAVDPRHKSSDRKELSKAS